MGIRRHCRAICVHVHERERTQGQASEERKRAVPSRGVGTTPSGTGERWGAKEREKSTKGRGRKGEWKEENGRTSSEDELRAGADEE